METCKETNMKVIVKGRLKSKKKGNKQPYQYLSVSGRLTILENSAQVFEREVDLDLIMQEAQKTNPDHEWRLIDVSAEKPKVKNYKYYRW